jgi:hypothetical protein
MMWQRPWFFVYFFLRINQWEGPERRREMSWETTIEIQVGAE